MQNHNKKKKKNQPFTIMIIPHSAAGPTKLTISKRVIKIAAICMGLFIILSGTVSYAYYSSQEEIRQVEALKKDNQHKQETINYLDDEIKAIEKQQESISQKQHEIKKLMGIKSESRIEQTPSRGGQGGYDRHQEEDFYLDIKSLTRAQSIKTSLDIQEKELDELIAKVNNDTRYFRSIPNQWPVEGEISSEYGWRKSPFGGRSQSFHEGIDIANNSGTEIVAAADGTVIFSDWKSIYGKTIIIEHGAGFTTKYGHNSALLVKPGDKVKKGDPIARMGNTGRSTGPHLHFTVMRWGQAQNPMIYLPAKE